MRRADIILMAGCLLTALLLSIFFVLHREMGSIVRISYDGAEGFEIELTDVDLNGQTKYYMICYAEEDKGNTPDTEKNTVYADRNIHIIYFADYPVIPEAGVYNLISITDGKVTMEAADCQDQICVHHKPIMSERESIICLPHKLVVEIEGRGGKTGADREQRRNTDLDGELLDGVTR